MVLATILAVASHDPVEGDRVEHPAVMVAKIGLGMVVMDTWEYWLHRWMHTYPWLYRNFHSVHHRITENFSFAALYNHPIEGLLLDSVGGAVSSLATFMSPLTAAVFYTVATLKTVDDHSGYSWPWVEAVFSNNASYHDVHHWGMGIKYNFSQPFFTFWDLLCGTELVREAEPVKDDVKHTNEQGSNINLSVSSEGARLRSRKAPASVGEGRDNVVSQ
ncbi:hypothetical protein HDU93_008056 [Gonapodya sp. JEL0774]|nr:hypothetical protein HDU93_008056 [Gonapodya sp. JEL0774]